MGSISIMFGVLGLLLATLQVAVFSMIAQEQDIPKVTYFYGLTLYGAIGIAWIVVGVGLFKLRSWARTTTIVLSVFSASFSILFPIAIGAVFIYLVLTGEEPVVGLIIMGAIAFILLAIFAATPIRFIIYLNKEDIKQKSLIPPTTLKQPLGVNILISPILI